MAAQTDVTPDLFALLIGIDCYLPNKLPKGIIYPSLFGAVRDITLVEEFLIKEVGIAKERIFKLSSTNTGTVEPPDPLDRWPTYENIVSAFKKLTEIAKPGDQIYIHYAGHGG